MKNILKLLKNVILAPFMIYLYNLVASSLGYILPINLFSIVVVGLLGFPGLVTLVVVIYLFV